ncbi:MULTISPECIES: alpha/beta hydrolase [Protofrankia]|uniref:Hydrolase superfamily dihydrolipoamide acyltransferase-like protein n=1 Tax=Protofrankia coriariae TaxID=1562887 RepID=A0ABR5F3M4_9ACTN|nr:MULTISPECIES: alpha/beta hydrolase [Protofrankia]KLL11316.1 hydrolase superfamily dihydrolipoamide acyltransferase-like protein [Protofrankia coriariae]ONH34857.1 alpha/beta hydrolase [Protofrankia sp. BMG5.30]
MSDVDELKRHVAAHAATLGIGPQEYQALTAGISHDGVGPGSWVYEWSRAAEEREAEGELLTAAAFYNFARFPFVDGNARLDALENCVRTIEEWRYEVPAVERLDLKIGNGTVGAWTTGLVGPDSLAGGQRRPLLIITGGIVSIKEQWVTVLLTAAELGLAAVVTELPGVGENTLRYTPESWRIFPAILDALADSADVSRTFALALSFSGHLALRWAVEDPRLRGIVTAGAPVRHLFTDRAWQNALPPVTRDTLAHLAGVDVERLPDLLPGFALSDQKLAAVNVPVRYVASTRDEIIPAHDVQLLRTHLSDLAVLEHDDVHGAPQHAAETRAWTVQALRDLLDSTP